ncbi:MAG: gluconate 2-dehydrogenase subunit 3 family protein [Thiopseudomonas sp.]|nr:gluconate 2-dehydrogenase subunit 3 family protein [Thiopseudomonas sp.]MCK9464303.1 gluconate 2-dehydrogenase subunit 3 family protein [Thiopseudomonas sp.]
MSDKPLLEWTPSRRQFIAATSVTTAIGVMPFWLHAAETEAAQPVAVPLEQYQPEYFEALEWAFIIAATARLIPSEGEGPGAYEARVPVFIDRQLAGSYGVAADWYMQGPHNPNADPAQGYQTPLNPKQIYRQAIATVNIWCEQAYGKRFDGLEPAQQDDVLSGLQQGVVKLDAQLRDFFTLLLSNTKEGYFSDPMYGGNHNMLAWSYIGFPGARASFKEWAAQHNVAYPLGPVSISGRRA